MAPLLPPLNARLYYTDPLIRAPPPVLPSPPPPCRLARPLNPQTRPRLSTHTYVSPVQPQELLEGASSRETVTLACEVIQACPWFEFADLDLGLGDPDYASSATLSSDGGDSECSSEGGIEEAFQGLLYRAGLQLRLDPAEAPLRTRSASSAFFHWNDVIFLYCCCVAT